MSDTRNNGSTFVNLNRCRSFNLTLTDTLTPLEDQVCGEVLLINKSGGDVLLFDNDYTDSGNSLLLNDLDSIVLRGITNTNQVSAQMVSGSGTFYYRTQYFSNNPSR